MNFVGIFVILSTCVVTVPGLQFKCHRDICDSSWQFCNDGEERCNTCTPEQCEPDVAEHIFHQCETKCNEHKSTTKKLPTTEPVTATAAPIKSQDASMMMELPLVIIISTILLLAILLSLGLNVIITRYVRQIWQKIDAERGEGTASYSTLSCRSESEKVPLLTSSAGVQVTDSSSHANKMEDIRVLAEAPAQADQSYLKQPSAPPSYVTDEQLRDQCQSPIACCDNPPTGLHQQATIEQDNGKCDNFGDTNLMSKDSSVDSLEVTRPKTMNTYVTV